MDKKTQFDFLLEELIIKIFTYLSPKKLGQVARVSKQWKKLVENEDIWQAKLRNDLTISSKDEFLQIQKQYGSAKKAYSQLNPCFNTYRILKKLQLNQLEELDVTDRFVPDTSQDMKQVKTIDLSSVINFGTSLNCLVIMPDGRIAVASSNFTSTKSHRITIISPYSNKRLILDEHTKFITGLSLSVDGRLASSSEDKTIKIWNTSTGKCEKTLSLNSYARAVIFLKNELVSSSINGVINFWDTTDYQHKYAKQLQGDVVNCFSAISNNLLAFGTIKGEVLLYDLESQKRIKKVAKFESIITTIIAITTNQILYADDNLINIFDIKADKILLKIERDKDCFLDSSYSFLKQVTVLPDGQSLLSSEPKGNSRDGTLALWNADGKFLKNFKSAHKSCVKQIAVSQNGQIVTASGKLKFWQFPPRSVSSQDIYPLLLELETNNPLKVLNLGSIALTEECISALINVIKKRQELEFELHVDINILTSIQSKEFLVALEENPKIKVFWNSVPQVQLKL